MEQMDTNKGLRVLMLEDTSSDADLIEHELRKAGIVYVMKRVETREAFIRALEEFRPDIILSDYHLPDFDGMAALEIVRHDHPEVPVIMVTGALPDIEAVELIHAGARDYVLKDRLARLAPAVQRALSAEQGVRARKMAEEKFRKISESAQDAIIMMEPDGRISFWNAAAERIFGYPAAEALGQELHQLITLPQAQAAFAQAFTHFQESGEGAFIGKVLELTALRKGGEQFQVELSISAARLNGQWHAIGIVRDITERKRAEQALNDSENRFRNLVETTNDWIWEVDERGVYTYASPRVQAILGYEPAEIIGKTPFQLMSPVEAKRVEGLFNQLVLAQQHLINIENTCLHKDGHPVILETSGVPIIGRDGKFCGYRGIDRDITERKQAEIVLAHANRALATLGAVNRQLVHITDENELLQAICQAIVGQRGYRMAWVGYAQQDAEKTIKIMAHAGYEEGYLDTMRLSWAENERGLGPSGRAVRSGTTQLSQDIANDPQYSLWRDAALQRGYLASIALPLSDGSGKVYGILNVYAEEADAFSPTEVDLLEEMAGDLVFGVNVLRIRHERDLALEQNQQHLAELQDSLEDTVRAIASMVEMRDPYTAGHQNRVADLAAAIAKQMGLPDEQIHAIHLAGVVHDLGKIQVPAEILSKPGRITDIEYSLIKIHPQAGYDILKGIRFPWPIAQMVLQHHEHLDGSGYPQGLKGDAILLEARILTVADVVEAMYSHRPYRPGLGLDAALAEVSRQRGIYFDPQVVDACLTIFREQKYRFAV